jgi:hypothetical protein
MLTITLDTNCIDDDKLRAAAAAAGADVASFSVARKEFGESSVAAHLEGITILPEQTVFADGFFADTLFADRFWASAIPTTYRLSDGTEETGDPFEAILEVLSNGSFPPPSSRKALSAGQRRQFRDAMHLSLHAQYRRHLFVTADVRAFIASGRREILEHLLGTQIRTPAEATILLTARSGASSTAEPN